MKNFFGIVSLAILAMLICGQEVNAGVESATKKPFAVGFMLGEPTGLTAKYRMGQDVGLDFGFGYAFSEYFVMYGDMLWHFANYFENRDDLPGSLTPYVGAGGGLEIATKDGRRHDTWTFIRVPVGAEWLVPKPSLSVFAEIAPGIEVLPETEAVVQGAVGARFRF